MTDASSHTALIVDDNPYNRDLAALALKYVGFLVSEAESGSRALELLRVQTFDLLVLDLAMPEMDGITVMRQLATLPPSGMHVVILTANAHMLTPELEAQATTVIQKPIDVMEFARLARTLIRPVANSNG